jgi:hypothetical protein
MSVSFVKNGECLRSSRFREVCWPSKCYPDLNHAMRRNAFRIEPLEPRVLLSADPIFAPAVVAFAPDRNDFDSISQAYVAAKENSKQIISAPMMARLLSNPVANSSAQNFAVDAALIDVGKMAMLSGFMDTSMLVAANEVFGGSGTLDASLFNSGVVSPGYSPGVQNITGDYHPGCRWHVVD